MMHSLLAFALASIAIGALAAEHFDYLPTSEWSGICQTGRMQSPINIAHKDANPARESAGRVEFGTFGTLGEYNVYFNGHTLEVEFYEFHVEAELRIPANAYMVGNSSTVREGDLMELEPVQMHFHTTSEHTINGYYAPAELHIVTRVKDGQSDYCDATGGCIAVFGMMLNIDGEGDHGNWALNRIFEVLPERTGPEHGAIYTSKLDLDALLPVRKDYYTYLGSFTTPPCTESVTWHVFAEPVPIERRLLEEHQELVAFTPGEDCTFTFHNVCSPPREKTNNRNIQPHYGREVYFVEDF